MRERRCGTCKHLDVEHPERRKKDGTVMKRYDNTLFNCTVPFEPVIKMPESFRTHAMYQKLERQMMAPNYGTACMYWEAIK